jgi:hypothetical protein
VRRLLRPLDDIQARRAALWPGRLCHADSVRRADELGALATE